MDDYESSMRSIQRDMKFIKMVMTVTSYLSIAIFIMLVSLVIRG